MAARRPRDFLLSAGLMVGALAFGGGTRALAQGPIPGLTSTPITFSGHADAFVAGPDGNAWLVDSAANAVGRLAVDGSAYQAFPAPTPSAGLNSIASGEDGNLWFTESSASKIGRITAAGAITEFALPPDFHFPQYSFVGTSGTIANGPDGNLWISGIGQMAKVTPQGSVTVVTVPPPAGIRLVEIGKCVAGTDGNLWCLSAAQIQGPYDYRVAKLTTAGGVTLYPETLQEFDIVEAPDGNVWISAGGFPDWNLTRVTPAGVETIYALPTTRESRLAVGNDGNIWFTERTTSGNLWQLVLSSATDDGHATFNSAPISQSYPEGIIAVTSAAGPSGIHLEQTSATGCQAGDEFEIVTSTDYGANITRVKTSAPDKCTHIYARAEIERFGDVGARVALICAVSSGVPNAAENPKLVLEAPGPALTEENLSKGGWTNCAIDDTKTKLECTAGSLGKGASLKEQGVIFYVDGLFTLTCTSDTPQIRPSPDGFDFGLISGLTPLSPKTVNNSQRSQQ